MNRISNDTDKLNQLTAAADVLVKLGDELMATPAKSVATAKVEDATPPASRPAAAPHALNGAGIAALAKEQMIALTGLCANTVSGLCKDEKGWHVILDMIELTRIPASSDVLATYDVILDSEGNLVSYRRTRRFYRGSTEDE